MTQHNSLMEWVQQTRKISKEVEYIAADTIDSIVTSLPLVHRHFIMDNADFFNEFCTRYHKPNPVKLLKKRKKEPKSACATCPSRHGCGSILGQYVEASVTRCQKALEMVRFQWWEIIDFMWDRPELINPNVIQDDYIRQKIEEACDKNKKNNPLKNGFVKKFGREWRDEQGNWHKERRKRF